MFRVLLVLLLGSVTTCSPMRAERSVVSGSVERAVASRPIRSDEYYAWAPETYSPRSRTPNELEALCGEADDALGRVAERIASRRIRGDPDLDGPELGFALRAEGSPYVWPRVWVFDGDAVLHATIAQDWQRWLARLTGGGTRRCGAAHAALAERVVVAGVVCQVFGELLPFPTRTRSGQWLTLEARLRSGESEPQVFVLGPEGRPRSVPTSFALGRARSSFVLDRPGTWLVQLLATSGGGPRPISEALVHADAPSPATYRATEAPGEGAGRGSPDQQAALERMINAARATESLAPLRRDPELDVLAFAHARSMAELRRLAHDTGSGDASARVEEAGLGLYRVGENVAHAATLERAHRAVWMSPSHRANLLFDQFNLVGVGVTSDPTGNLWVCELMGQR